MLLQSLGAATLNEFKRSHKKSQTEGAATAAAAAAAAADGEVAEDTPSVTARLDLLLEKKRNAVLGPSKISTAESRGEREYQARRVEFATRSCVRLRVVDTRLPQILLARTLLSLILSPPPCRSSCAN